MDASTRRMPGGWPLAQVGSDGPRGKAAVPVRGQSAGVPIAENVTVSPPRLSAPARELRGGGHYRAGYSLLVKTSWWGKSDSDHWQELGGSGVKLSYST